MGPKIFRDYDRAGLDAQLNLRARWPQHGEYFARWASESAAVRARLDGRLDLSYGPSAGQKLDLFLPPSGGPAPCLAFIHGGYWQSLDKGDFSYMAPPFLEAGIAFASLNYDLAPKVGVGEIVRQIRTACAWLHREGAALGLDPARLYVAGHSAGGHLAAMVVATDWADLEADAALPAGLIKGACGVSGVYDLLPLSLSYHQEVLRLDAETIRTMCPMTSQPRGRTPIVLAVGAEETAEFLRQQAAYAGVCREAGAPVQVVDLPGRDHFTAVDALAEPDHPLFEATLALLRGDGVGAAS